MKKGRFSHRILSLLLASLFLFLLAVPASATTLSSEPSGDLSVQPRGFVKTKTIYVQENVFYDFFQDDNWWSQTHLTVTFKSTEGPQTIGISVWDNDGYSSGGDISVGEALSFKINPAPFRIMATKIDGCGPDGNVTLIITLS